MSRAQSIQAILNARKPMAERAAQADSTLYQIEGEIRKFKNFIPRFSGNLAPEVAENLKALDPAIDQLLTRLADEKGKISRLAQRFSRSTLNIGVVGPARNGKSTLLQQITGLTSEEIPSGNKGHLTGAPSFVYHRDSDTTEGDLQFFTESEFLADVVAPYYRELGWLGNAPSSLEAFRQANLVNESGNDATRSKIFDKLLETRDSLESFHQYFGQGKKVIPKQEIREWIAQEGVATEGQTPPKLHKWRAVKYANIHCRFSQQDVGSISVSDTPGLGDYISGAEERLVELVGRDLDAALFVRMPSQHGPIVTPPDTNLYTLISRAIPEFTPKDWSYFIINKTTENAGNLDHFERDLEDKRIHTRSRHRVDCSDRGETLVALDQILSDISNNLGKLDQRLFDIRMESLGDLQDEIQNLADQAAKALPSAGASQPDLVLLNKLFEKAWKKLGSSLKQQVDSWRTKRNETDQDFLSTVSEIFSKLNEGPGLPEVREIEEEAAAQGLMGWHADKLNELRVEISNAFESVDETLKTGFDDIRAEILSSLQREDGGKLAGLQSMSSNLWETLVSRWEGLPESRTMIHAIELLLSASLSFRGFIQPRVRGCLDVLDSDSTEAALFVFAAGDDAATSKEKLELAWQNACFACRGAIEEMAHEPNMARFAAVEDFRGAILHSGGDAAKQAWHLFYYHNRADIWKDDFAQLEEGTRMRREWDAAVKNLRESAASF